jgi:ketosteroid isomerase-like protein
MMRRIDSISKAKAGLKAAYSKKRLWTLALALTFAGLSSSAFADELSDASQASDNARGVIQKAITNRDSGLFASLFTSEGAIITPNGYTVSGRLKIRLSVKMIMLTGETGTLNAVRKSMTMIDGAAYETGSYTFRHTVSKSKENAVVSGHYTLIWRLEDKTWKIHRAIGLN